MQGVQKKERPHLLKRTSLSNASAGLYGGGESYILPEENIKGDGGAVYF